MKKLMLLGLSMIAGISVMAAKVNLSEMTDLLRNNKYDELTTQINNALVDAKSMTQPVRRQVVMYKVVVAERKGELKYTDVEAEVEKLGKEYGLDDKQIFICKYQSLDPWWAGDSAPRDYYVSFQKKNVQQVLSFVNDTTDPGWYSEFMIVLGSNGYPEVAIEYGLNRNRVECIRYATLIGPEKVLEVAESLLLKNHNISAKDVNEIVTKVLDNCYDVKYNDGVKDLLTKADNKFYKNIGKSAEWKTACTIIQLGLKRFNK